MWVARDQDGQLFLYISKPWRYNAWNNNDPAIPIDENLFPDLKWTDKPLKVELKEVKP